MHEAATRSGEKWRCSHVLHASHTSPSHLPYPSHPSPPPPHSHSNTRSEVIDGTNTICTAGAPMHKWQITLQAKCVTIPTHTCSSYGLGSPAGRTEHCSCICTESICAVLRRALLSECTDVCGGGAHTSTIMHTHTLGAIISSRSILISGEAER